MPICKICKFQKTIFFCKINKYSYYECPRCITLFLHPKPLASQIANYYKKSFEFTAGETNEKDIRKRAKVILNNLKKINPAGKTLLDVGSGYGYFLDEAMKMRLNITGIEPSKSLVSTPINQLIGVNIVNTSFADYFEKRKNKKFDFITIIHTIEHVINPKEMVEDASKLLNPAGILFAETPNLDSHLFRAEKYNYTFLTPPDHIWLFSKKSFKKMVGNISNIQIKKISSYSYPEHLMGILKNKLEIRNSKSETISKIQNLNIKTKNVSNLKNSDLGFVSSLGFRISDFKYILFDKLLAPFFTPLLNIGIYGSILELYIKKK